MDLRTTVAAIGTTVNDLALGAGASVGASAAVEGSICAQSSLGADADYEALFAPGGRATACSEWMRTETAALRRCAPISSRS